VTTSPVRFHFDTENVTALSAFVQILSSDVFIGSDSSFSWFAGFIAERPVTIMAPNSREKPPFRK
jgi:hypothetical protein